MHRSHAAGRGFLPDVCVEWEKAAEAAQAFGTRVVLLRIGLVLGPNGGALEKMLLPFQMGVGGVIGTGRQWMSWIHVDDIVGLILHALDNGSVQGPVNATAPHPGPQQGVHPGAGPRAATASLSRRWRCRRCTARCRRS